MLKKCLLLTATLSAPLLAAPFEPIDCADDQNLQMEPEKRYQQQKNAHHIEQGGKEAFLKQFTDPEQERVAFKSLDFSRGQYQKTEQGPPFADDLIQFDITPHVTYRIGNALLTGSNFGEFGGELMLLKDNGETRRLAQLNVEDIYRMPFGMVVTSGLAHMSSNAGQIYLINPDFTLTLLYALTGMPRSSYLLPEGDLLINSYVSGTDQKLNHQVLTKDGLLRRVSCIDEDTQK
ncbi:hypothetical protein [Gallaecimonas xiamenensis]|uniref:PBS lyase n=1 Tax=Gallaecimonas xiamenensis 3-C-1 TaxID=745411 RepID=K2KEF9_9GAMM|nr:hypothetical protein [Gallaecimonas xiamenensis]EKE75655.1 PBS lyase [Gallaecimonas xiamenensis 3-C-1]